MFDMGCIILMLAKKVLQIEQCGSCLTIKLFRWMLKSDGKVYVYPFISYKTQFHSFFVPFVK